MSDRADATERRDAFCALDERSRTYRKFSLRAGRL